MRRDLVDDHEQVAVHEGRDQRPAAAARAARSSACRTSGKLVVAPSSTALHVPRIALAVTVANVARPCLGHRHRAEVDGSPPRTNGTNTATNSDEREHDPRARARSCPGGRARAPRRRPARARRRRTTGHAPQRRRDGDERDAREADQLRPRIEAVDRARRVAARSPVLVAGVALMRRAAAGGAQRRGEPVAEREHAAACRRSRRARSRRARRRRPGTRSRAPASPPGSAPAGRSSRNALSAATRSSPSGEREANGETAVARPDGDARGRGS